MSQASSSSNLPPELIAKHNAGWKFFTKCTVVGSVAVTVLLLLMLVFLVKL